MKIYLASSWRNAHRVSVLARTLRTRGYLVDCFCDGQGALGEYRYVFKAKDEVLGVEFLTAPQFLQLPQSKRAYSEDKGWLDWADVCILVLPAGNSSHLEAGYACGQHRLLAILAPSDGWVKGEWDVMYGFADAMCDGEDALLDMLEKWRDGTDNLVGLERKQ